MTIVVNCTGLQTPGGKEDRDIAYLSVEYNGNTYDWLIYVPLGVNLGEYIEQNIPKIQADIDAKETAWNALDPKTRTIDDPVTGQQITVDIQKEEIVKPDFPDYFAKRRDEYPDFRMYLDGVVKNDQEQIQLYIDACNAVKAKYPKP